MAVSHASILLVPVSDQERALAFYRDALGFSVFADNQVAPTMRWLHLRAPDGGLDLTLADWLGDDAGRLQGLFLEVGDLDAAGAAVEAAGYAFAQGVDETPYGRMRPLADPDGNQLVLHQPADGLLD